MTCGIDGTKSQQLFRCVSNGKPFVVVYNVPVLRKSSLCQYGCIRSGQDEVKFCHGAFSRNGDEGSFLHEKGVDAGICRAFTNKAIGKERIGKKKRGSHALFSLRRTQMLIT